MDAWAVGYYDDGEGLTSGILRWDGSYFHLVSDTPNTSLLYGVAAVSSTDVWAVGENYNATTVVEHWDGTQWKVTLAQNAAEPFLNSFRGATAIPNSKEVFAVGTPFYPPDDFADTLVYLYAC